MFTPGSLFSFRKLKYRGLSCEISRELEYHPIYLLAPLAENTHSGLNIRHLLSFLYE